MEWLIGIYLVVGLVKTLGKLGNSNPGAKPAWMVMEKNPLTWSLYFCLYVLIWPFAKG